MLYVVHKPSERDLTWHVGERVPSPDIQDVREVQADGDELDFIASRFSNLPMSSGRVVQWFGDHAKFIVANL